MVDSFEAMVPKIIKCKCCQADALAYGVVDFSKNCEAHSNPFLLPLAAIPIYYHRCSRCKLIFTTAFDLWSHEDFRQHIYNEEYAKVDPEYALIRPQRSAQQVHQMFGRQASISVLDYGGGNGNFAMASRALGFRRVETYDPFTPEFSKLPDEKFDLIVCVEVAEHSPTPMQTFQQMASLVSESGLIFLSTASQPTNIDLTGVAWWYVAPRNGHVTVYSIECLKGVAGQLGMNFATDGGSLHFMFRKVPDFARHLFSVNA